MNISCVSGQIFRDSLINFFTDCIADPAACQVCPGGAAFQRDDCPDEFMCAPFISPFFQSIAILVGVPLIGFGRKKRQTEKQRDELRTLLTALYCDPIADLTTR